NSNCNKSGRLYQRSQSCAIPSSFAKQGNETNLLPDRPRERLIYPPDSSQYGPPNIRKFALDFHSEVDEVAGATYGTGGALLETIRRVVRNFRGLRYLRLMDLFLDPSDARRLTIDLAEVAGLSLESLSLVHLCKVSLPRQRRLVTDHGSNLQSNLLGHRTSSSITYPEAKVSRDWYLSDVRWLEARPNLLHGNPLADIAFLFPNLTSIELAPTQLTQGMLLRLLYNTALVNLALTRVSTGFYFLLCTL
ncbi:unnamed protein product, partial [Protopolystoma xenopodis]